MNTATVTFDTLAIAEDLKISGFNEVQAKAITQAMKNSLAAKELVTKQDLKESLAETKLEIIKWVIGIVLGAGILQTSLIASLILRMLPS